MKTYFPQLDLVRFFAAFWVMNYHYFLEYNNVIRWERYGNLGVQLFFIISGFVITQSLQGKSLKEFALGRFIRLYPLFWILCTTTYIITLLVPFDNPVHFREYLFSMTMIGDQFDSFIGYIRLVDASYWTLSVELIFYVLIGIFVAVFSYERLRYFFLTWFAISILAFATHYDKELFIKFLLVRHASYFIFGGMLALIATQKAKNVYEKYFDWTLLTASASYAIYIHPWSIPSYDVVNPYDNHIITILHFIFFIGIGLLVYFSPHSIHKKITHLCVVIGGLTYPLYLMHQTIGNTFIRYCMNRYGFAGASLAYTFEVLIILIAYVVYRYDKMLRGWLRKKYTTKEGSTY